MCLARGAYGWLPVMSQKQVHYANKVVVLSPDRYSNSHFCKCCRDDWHAGEQCNVAQRLAHMQRKWGGFSPMDTPIHNMCWPLYRHARKTGTRSRKDVYRKEGESSHLTDRRHSWIFEFSNFDPRMGAWPVSWPIGTDNQVTTQTNGKGEKVTVHRFQILLFRMVPMVNGYTALPRPFRVMVLLYIWRLGMLCWLCTSSCSRVSRFEYNVYDLRKIHVRK